MAVAAAPALIGDVAIVPLAASNRNGLACLPRAADDAPIELWFYATENGVVLPPAALGTVAGVVDRVIGVDGKIGPLLEKEAKNLYNQGLITYNSYKAFSSNKFAYETTNTGAGWFKFHHHHMHVSTYQTTYS